MEHKVYTTGQVIDLLKPGQKAFDVEKPVNIIGKDSQGNFSWFRADGSPGPDVVITWWFLNVKWQLLPQYITFEEARQAYEEGKTIRIEWESGWNEYREGTWEKVSWVELTKGKWSVVEDDSE